MSNLITLKLDGLPTQDGHMLLSDFLARAENLLAALNAIDCDEGIYGETTVSYRIVDARHSSPLSLTIEPVLKEGFSSLSPNHIERRRDQFFRVIDAIQRGTRPGGVGDNVLRPLQQLALGVGQAYSSGTISNGIVVVSLDHNFEINAERALVAPTETFSLMNSEESKTVQYSGEIQGLVHSFFAEAKKPYLVMRELSTRDLIKCYFTPEMYEKAVETLGEREGVVFVEGMLSENTASKSIESIRVRDFRPAPLFDLAFHKSFIGSRPDLTGTLTSEDSLERARDG
jgi:hypothetical protein